MLIRTAAFPGTQPRPMASRKPARERAPGEQLLAEIEAFLRRQPRMTRAGFGRLAAGNPQLVDRLLQGQEPQRVTFDRVRAFIARYEA
jgi:hypothetical protein